MSIKLRVSPSGPFIKDATSGTPLTVGPGTPGLVFRTQGGTTAIDTAAGGTLLDSRTAYGNGYFPAFSLPPGFLYDVEAGYMCSVAGIYTTELEYSTDEGANWNQMRMTADNVIFPIQTAVTADAVRVQSMKFDARALVVTAGPGIRIRLTADGPDPSNAYNCWLRATQYVS